MDRTERTIKAIAEAIARGECPPRTTPREWTHFEKQAKAVFYDLVLTVQLHDVDETSPAKVGGDEREEFIDKCIRLLEASRHAARVVGIEHIEAFPYLPEYDEAVDWLKENRAALSADGGEELTDKQIVYAAQTAGVRVLMDGHFGDANYTNVSASWPAFAAFARAIAANQARKGE